MTVVRASTGQVLATLSTVSIPANLSEPLSAAFDGERIFVVGNLGGALIYRATDLTVIRTQSIGGAGFGTCSDGMKFFTAAPAINRLTAF